MEWHFQVVTISTTLSLIIPNCCRVEQVCSPWQRDIRSTNVYSERSFTNLWATEQPLSSSSFSVFRRAAVDKFTRRPDRMSLFTWFYCCAELMKLSKWHTLIGYSRKKWTEFKHARRLPVPAYLQWHFWLSAGCR